MHLGYDCSERKTKVEHRLRLFSISGSQKPWLGLQCRRDCIGALQFLPDGQEPQPMSELTGELVDEAQIGAILSDLDLAPLGIRRENDFRISVAGAQEKTALLRKESQWIEPTGTTPTTHIIKPQIGRLPNGMDLSDSVENEYVCLKLMEAFGLRAANVEMAQFGDKKALVVFT